MNAKQRRRNRRTAWTLHDDVHMTQIARHPCEDCGETGTHWVLGAPNLYSWAWGIHPPGRWVCLSCHTKEVQTKTLP